MKGRYKLPVDDEDDIDKEWRGQHEEQGKSKTALIILEDFNLKNIEN